MLYQAISTAWLNIHFRPPCFYLAMVKPNPVPRQCEWQWVAYQVHCSVSLDYLAARNILYYSHLDKQICRLLSRHTHCLMNRRGFTGFSFVPFLDSLSHFAIGLKVNATSHYTDVWTWLLCAPKPWKIKVTTARYKIRDKRRHCRASRISQLFHTAI